jgi:hypothetical protein
MRLAKSAKREWKRFRNDTPGERFVQQRDRMRRKPPAIRWLGTILGGLLVAAGVVLLIVPGPGIPLIAIGAALVATQSRSLARGLDWVELRLRGIVSSLRHAWMQRYRA